MTASPGFRDSHPSDADLVRFLDDELPREQRSEVETHIGQCAACAVRMTQLERRAAQLSRLLDAADPVGTDRGLRLADGTRRPRAGRRFRVRLGTRPIWTAAAVLALLITAAVTVSPVRAWIVERSQGLWEMVSGGDTPAFQEPEVTQGAGPASGSISFTPTGPELVLQVASRQASGTMTIRAGDVSEVSAQILGEATSEGLVVLPGRLRVSNDSTSTVSYLFTVPTGLTRVTVELEGETPVEFVPRESEGQVVVALSRRAN